VAETLPFPRFAEKGAGDRGKFLKLTPIGQGKSCPGRSKQRPYENLMTLGNHARISIDPFLARTSSVMIIPHPVRRGVTDPAHGN
jgi:hypothetical protein